MRQTIHSVSESAEQQCLFQWADFQSARYPELDLLYHIPNGGHRLKSVAGKLKAEGVKAGVPDLCLPVARGGYHGLYIEMKVGKNQPTAEQKQWLVSLSAQGYGTAVCWGWEQASQCILHYLKGSWEQKRP